MRKVIVAAFAALALLGCTPDKAEKAATPPPQPVQSAPVPPAPQPVASVTIMAETAMCKNDWAKSWAEKHNTTVAAAERHARRMPPTTPSWTYAGMAVTFTKTVWHSCEAAIKKARETQAQASVQNTETAALVARLQAENQRLTAENHTLRGLAYQNPEETDPAKLISNQARVTDLERRLKEAEQPITLTTIIIAGLVGLISFGLGIFVAAKRWRRRATRHGGLRSP